MEEDDHSSSVKCGEIFFHERKLTFNCTHCDTNFDHFPTYTTHFLTCFKIHIETTETDSFNLFATSSPSLQQEKQTIHSAKEQSSDFEQPFEPRNNNNKSLKQPPTELLNLVVNRRRHYQNPLIVLRGRGAGGGGGRESNTNNRTTRTRTKRGRGKIVVYNCRACGKKYHTKVAFKVHKITNNCKTSNLKDALRLAENTQNNVIRDEGAEGLSQLNPPIGK